MLLYQWLWPLLWKGRSERLFTTGCIVFHCHSANAPNFQYLLLNVYIKQPCLFHEAVMMHLLCCFLWKLLWFGKRGVGFYEFERSPMSLLWALHFFLEKHAPNKPPQNTKDVKNKGYFLIGEFWNVQTKQLFFQLLQVLNNSKKILCYDLSQEIILSWSCWTAVFIASPEAVIFNFSTCYLHNDSSKF